MLNISDLQIFHNMVRTWQRFYYMMSFTLMFVKYEMKESDDVNEYTFDIRKLNITESLIDIKRNFNKYGVFIMRPYENQKDLIIGCGKKPLRNCGGYLFIDEQEEKEYHEEHSHDNAYTIDPLHSTNPDVVAAFELNTFEFIPDESFEVIEFEGILLNVTPVLINNLVRLLKPNGYVSMLDKPILYKANNKIYYCVNNVELTVGKNLMNSDEMRMFTNYEDSYYYYKNIMSQLSVITNFIITDAINRIHNLHSYELEEKEYKLKRSFGSFIINSADLDFFENNCKFPIENNVLRNQKKVNDNDMFICDCSDKLNDGYSYLL
jgi:hypothetical protein